MWLESGRGKIVIFLVETSTFLRGLFRHIGSENKNKKIALHAVYCSISHTISGVEPQVALRQAEKVIEHVLSDSNDQ